jgi:hypothetical protein
VEACRAYIRNTLLSALDGLDAAGNPDGGSREKLSVSLAIRDEIDVDVPKFFLRVGRALHALQDSFTHTFRRPDDLGKITVVLNFVELTQDTLEEGVDGPPHASEMDVCNDPDELRTKRREVATEASTAALLALLDPGLDRSGKERAIDAMLDKYVAFDTSSNCNLDNNWCDAPERKYKSPVIGCQFNGAPRENGGGFLWLGALGAVLLGLRKRWFGTLAGLIGVQAFASNAHANDSDKSGPIDAPLAALAGDSQAATPGKLDVPGAFFARAAVGASYDNAAFSGGLGVRWQITEAWMVGFDGEWNPYFATTPGKIRSGSANAYFSLIRRFQLKRETLNVRSSIALGGSMLLFDLVGADKYSMGPFFGISFLGAEWKAARGFYLTIDPTYIAIPIPNVVGVPFMYAQYRFLVGVEFGG